jgi:hypothetical protein
MRVVTTMRAFWADFATKSEMSPMCSGRTCDDSKLSTAVKHGAFIDDINSHSGPTDLEKAMSEIEGKTWEAYWQDWIEKGTDTFCVDASNKGTSEAGVAAPWAQCP